MASLDLAHDIIVRWDDADPRHIPLLQAGGVTAIVAEAPDAEFRESWARAGISVGRIGELRFVSVEELGETGAAAKAVLRDGLWPGASRPPEERGQDYAVTGASRQPWVNTNMHWVAWLRALYPRRAAVLGYLPDAKAGFTEGSRVRFETLELALTEARVGGGNYILALEKRYREGLLGGDPKAMGAWRQLGQTARWLQANDRFYRQPTIPIVTVLAEPSEESAEIVKLLFRQNASPAVESLADPPAPDPRRRLAVVAVNLGPGRPASGERILAHARAGSVVVLDDGEQSGWWRSAAGERLLEEYDREFYRLGRGRLVVYKQRIKDPSNFALDVIDVVTHQRRAVRLWGGSTVVATVKAAPAEEAGGGKASLILVNYGGPIGADMLVHVQGNYSTAEMQRPEGGPLVLKTAKRGTSTEVEIPGLRETGIVLFR